jgi:hypothetical protein
VVRVLRKSLGICQLEKHHFRHNRRNSMVTMNERASCLKLMLAPARGMIFHPSEMCRLVVLVVLVVSDRSNFESL